MEKTRSLSVGVVVERKAVDNPWTDAVYRPVSLVVGPPDVEPWHEMRAGEERTLYLAGTARLEVHRKDTASYKYNLDHAAPSLTVVLKPAKGPHPWALHLVTASPAEGDAYAIGGDMIVERVPMDAALIAWLRDFVQAHHVETPFRKRQRGEAVPDEPIFGKTPIFENRRIPARGGGHGE